jgi:hypothetical protein
LIVVAPNDAYDLVTREGGDPWLKAALDVAPLEEERAP